MNYFDVLKMQFYKIKKTHEDTWVYIPSSEEAGVQNTCPVVRLTPVRGGAAACNVYY